MLRGGLRWLTAPNATDSIVCILASSMELSTPFLLSKARPAKVQKRTCLIPTDTKCVSESGRNSATKILWVWPIRLATLAPEKRKTKFSRAAKSPFISWGRWSRLGYLCLTFLPLPDGDGVFVIQAHRQQELSCGAKADRADPTRVGAAQHRQRLLCHGVPHVDGWRRCCRAKKKKIYNNYM